jgi:diguanylate cyclase (GGDEF)-like protein
MAWLEDIGPPAAEALLEPLILRDQLAAVRRASITALQVHLLLGLITVTVAIQAGNRDEGVAWFAICVVTGVMRVIPNFLPLTTISDRYGAGDLGTEQGHLRLISMTALASGIVWSLVPLLCAGYTSPNSVFYLTVVSGIAAGGVANSTACARVAICFMLPPLLSIAFCLIFYSGNFDRYCLAAVSCLYIAELIQISRRSEAVFRESSRMKNAATTLAQSLTEANAQAIEVADQMSFRACHDDLTDLLNRSGFMQEVNPRLGEVSSPLCLMVLDLDGFKSVNDLFGHKAGDEVLIEVARRLREALPDQCVVARIGGDEFAIFYALDATAEPAAALAARLINIMDVPFTNFDAGRIGASIGIYVAAQATQVAMIAEMLAYADEALYAAKNAGRNRYFLFDDSLRIRREMRRAVERDLRQALSDRALQVWYQPVFGQDGKELVSLEALLRWEHPNFGWIPPEELLAIASITGLSELLIEFILAEVCVMMQNLISLRLDHIWVAMNLSPREVSRIGIDELVLAKLRALALSPAMLEIEITEETAMNTRAVQDKLNRLSEAGIRIAVDDFGVGYSSLASLRNLQVNRIKIDRCFVTGISASGSDQILVQAILNLGQSLGIEVVAEGIETAADLHLLQTLGCERMQGYYLKSPASKAQTLDWLQTMHAVQTPQLQT